MRNGETMNDTADIGRGCRPLALGRPLLAWDANYTKAKNFAKMRKIFLGKTLCSFERLKCDLKIISFGKCKDQVCAMVPTKWSIVAQLFGQNGRHAW